MTELSEELDKPADPERAAAVVRWLERRLTRMLDACQVGVLRDEGDVDPPATKWSASARRRTAGPWATSPRPYGPAICGTARCCAASR
ncbi:hypothetical protein NKH77_03040 [Streptomyces sp. M19]